MKNRKNPNEQSLLKALDRLEKGSVPKEMKDADGGFATEGDGDELQVSASEDAEPKAKKSMKKAARRAAEESEDDVSKAMESSDEEHSPAATSSPDISGDEESSNDDADEESSAPPAKKSLKKAACDKCGKKMTLCKCGTMKSIKKSLMEDPDAKDFVDGSAFVEQLVDTVSDTVDGFSRSLAKSMKQQDGFNGRLSKAMVAVGEMLVDMNAALSAVSKENRKLRKALANTPVDERHSVLSEDEIPDHPLEKGNKSSKGRGTTLAPKDLRKSLEIIEELARQGKCPHHFVSEVEIHKSLDSLDPETIKAVQARL